MSSPRPRRAMPGSSMPVRGSGAAAAGAAAAGAGVLDEDPEVPEDGAGATGGGSLRAGAGCCCWGCGVFVACLDCDFDEPVLPNGSWYWSSPAPCPWADATG